MGTDPENTRGQQGTIWSEDDKGLWSDRDEVREIPALEVPSRHMSFRTVLSPSNSKTDS